MNQNRNTADRLSPAECYAEYKAVLDDLLANPGREPASFWMTYEQELEQAQKTVADLEPIKHLSRWPDAEDVEPTVKAMKHVCKRVRDEETGEFEEGEYEYRGYRITRNDDIPNGYWGRWRLGFFSSNYATDTLASIKAEIDRRIAAREAEKGSVNISGD